MSLIKTKTVYEATNGAKFENIEDAEAYQLMLDISKLLNANLEGISCRDHENWIKRVITNKEELIKILTR